VEEAPPFALLETIRGTRRIAAVSLEAAQLKLYPGQKATDAFALVPDLATAEAEPQADAAALAALAHWCVRFSPAVAVDPPDGLFLDVEGVAHLWEGEAALRPLLELVIGVLRISLASLVDDLWMLWDKQKQTLHDKIAGTIVVKN